MGGHRHATLLTVQLLDVWAALVCALDEYDNPMLELLEFREKVVSMRLPSEEDIRQAIEVWEKKTWDFKAKEALGDPKVMQPKAVEEKDWELCRDIASFANTSGGYMVVGVEDDRKNRAVQGHAISDTLKNRISQVVRSKIAPLPSYDVDIVEVQGKGVTVFLIEEGDADLCTVNGTVFVRDLNGKAPASGAEITRIMRRRLGRKLNPAPTDREIIGSP
jgi:predicted HTH transcriptional regulator